MGWIEIAEQAEGQLSSTEITHGSTMARRAEVAQALGVTSKTLANYIDALRTVRALQQDDPQSGRAFLRLNPTSIAVYSRWMRRDRQTALSHARAAAAHGLSTARIVAAEKEAREAATALPTLLDKALADGGNERAWQQPGGALASALHRHLRTLPRLGVLEPAAADNELAVAMGVDQVLRWTGSPARPEVFFDSFDPWTEQWFLQRCSDGPFDVIGVMEMHRGQVGDAHRRNAKTTIAKAALAAMLYPLILILTEDEVALGEVEAMLPPLDGKRLGPHAAFGPGPMHFSRDGGSILFSEPASFLPTWWQGRRP